MVSKTSVVVLKTTEVKLMLLCLTATAKQTEWLGAGWGVPVDGYSVQHCVLRERQMFVRLLHLARWDKYFGSKAANKLSTKVSLVIENIHFWTFY